MLFEAYAIGKKQWLVLHIPTGENVMGYHLPFSYREQAEAYATELEASPFIWVFTDPKEMIILNDKKEIFAFVDAAYKRAEQVK